MDDRGSELAAKQVIVMALQTDKGIVCHLILLWQL